MSPREPRGAAGEPCPGVSRAQRRVRVAAPLPFVCLLLLLASGSLDARRASVAGNPLDGLRAGQWVGLTGAPQAPLEAQCLQLRVLAGDFLDDDWAIRGTVLEIDTLRREFVVAGVRVRVDESTLFDSPGRNFKGLGDLRHGMFVDVEGTYLRSGRFLALEVDDETTDVIRRPELLERVEVVGRIQRIDTRARVVEVLGIRFQLTDGTRARSLIH